MSDIDDIMRYQQELQAIRAHDERERLLADQEDAERDGDPDRYRAGRMIDAYDLDDGL